MSRTHQLMALVLGTLASGCFGEDATGSVNGGQVLLADLEANPACAADAGDTWTNLYGCYFGPNGKASCAAQNQCHGSAGDPGGSYFVCGETQASCYQGMTQSALGPATGAASVQAVELYLRAPGSPPGALMPCNLTSLDGVATCSEAQGNAYAFTADDMDRINAWIDAGAPNN